MQYIIDFKQNVSEPEISNFLAVNNLTIIKVFNNFERVYLVSGSEPLILMDIVESINNDDESIINLLDYTYTVSDNSPSITFALNEDKNWWKTYSCAVIDLDQLDHTIKRKGKNIRVYILDSGINDTHIEFENTTIKKLSTITNDFNDTSGHGTAIASVIAGKECGLTNAELNILKVFDKNVSTKLSDILNALDIIIDDFTKNNNLAGVVNISWSIPRNLYIEQKLQILIDLGLIVVCSAGNNGTSITDVTPACMDSVLTIGAYNQNLEPCDFSNFTGTSSISLTQQPTNYGSLDGWAPGIDIYTAGLNNSYNFSAGTSMSAAIATGALVYNLSEAMINDNQLSHGLINVQQPVKIFTNYTLNRSNTLNLSGNYTNSVNKIVTYVVSRPLTHFAPIVKGIFRKGKITSTQIFRPDIIKSVSCEKLPDGITINNGWLIGEPLDNLGSSGYLIKELELIYILIDNSVKYAHLTLVLLNENLDTQTINDPVLNYTLQQLSCTPEAGCTSFPECGAFQCIVEPKPYDCFCAL